MSKPADHHDSTQRRAGAGAGGRRPARCRSHGPGHVIHFIQARHAAEYRDPHPASAAVGPDGWIRVVDRTGGHLYWNHRPLLVARALADSGGYAQLIATKSMLVVPTPQGRRAAFSIATPARRWPCRH